jgi:hypothetical protein
VVRRNGNLFGAHDAGSLCIKAGSKPGLKDFNGGTKTLQLVVDLHVADKLLAPRFLAFCRSILALDYGLLMNIRIPEVLVA